MGDLIAALQIFQKYKDVKWPTNCEHDVLCIMEVGEDEVSAEDKEMLNKLDFYWSDGYECWASYRFGSA